MKEDRRSRFDSVPSAFSDLLARFIETTITLNPGRNIDLEAYYRRFVTHLEEQGLDLSSHSDARQIRQVVVKIYFETMREAEAEKSENA